mmetsp:Transcript_98018/g.285910  ORF Transcript_98018/g.285910 Transcript_98018/m.285910 type:complete len:225 (+) Transcript_98018:276-950(+)
MPQIPCVQRRLARRTRRQVPTSGSEALVIRMRLHVVHTPLPVGEGAGLKAAVAEAPGAPGPSEPPSPAAAVCLPAGGIGRLRVPCLGPPAVLGLAVAVAAGDLRGVLGACAAGGRGRAVLEVVRRLRVARGGFAARPLGLVGFLGDALQAGPPAAPRDPSVGAGVVKLNGLLGLRCGRRCGWRHSHRDNTTSSLVGILEQWCHCCEQTEQLCPIIHTRFWQTLD